MRKLMIQLLGFTFILSSVLSCASRVSNLDKAVSMSYVIYIDLAPQITSALQNSSMDSTDSTRVKRLKLINQKLDEYKMARDECLKAMYIWEKTGNAPEYADKLYVEMWKPLLDAQTLAATIYIYASECASNTAIKGKACP